MVPVVGVEPTRLRSHWILNPACLPIPPYWRVQILLYNTMAKNLLKKDTFFKCLLYFFNFSMTILYPPGPYKYDFDIFEIVAAEIPVAFSIS